MTEGLRVARISSPVLVAVGLHVGLASSIAKVNEEHPQYAIQIEDTEEEAYLQHHNLRGGPQIMLQIGHKQGIQFLGELGYTSELTQDLSFTAEYFWSL